MSNPRAKSATTRHSDEPGDRQPRRNNRDRILEVSLELFNELGSVTVSTKLIAEKLGISPGNFYYHFTDKEHVIRALWARMEGSVLPSLAAGEEQSAPPPEALANFFTAIIDTMVKFRFIPRDIDELVARDTQLAESFRAQMDLGRKQLLVMLDGLITNEFMRPPPNPSDLERICTNIQVVLINWIRFLTTTQNRADISENEIVDGALQGFVMLEPYLTPEYAEGVRKLLESRKRKQQRTKVALRAETGQRRRGRRLLQPR